MIAASLRARLRLQPSFAPARLGRVAHLEAPLYAAAQSHFATKRWEGNCPLTPANDTYSAELYGELAHATLMEYDETAQDAPPLFCAQRRPSLLRCGFGGRRFCPTSWLSSGVWAEPCCSISASRHVSAVNADADRLLPVRDQSTSPGRMYTPLTKRHWAGRATCCAGCSPRPTPRWAIWSPRSRTRACGPTPCESDAAADSVVPSSCLSSSLSSGLITRLEAR